MADSQVAQVSARLVLTLFSCVLAAGWCGSVTETTVSAAPGDVALLPCYNLGNVTPSLTTWIKGAREVSRGPARPPTSDQRLAVLHDGSLNIRTVTPGDEGIYLCNSSLGGNSSFQARVLLQVTSKWRIC